MADIFVLAGTDAPCAVCSPYIPEMRRWMKWEPHLSTTYFYSPSITPQQQDLVRRAINERLHQS